MKPELLFPLSVTNLGADKKLRKDKTTYNLE
jgi:hypothetical protein